MQPWDVGIVGMGYAGSSLAAAFVEAGLRVLGVDHDTELVSKLRQRDVHFFEPGVDQALALARGTRFEVTTSLPGDEAVPPALVIVVDTPVDEQRRPRLTNIEAAFASITPRITEDTLVVVRSTVPVGTTRRLASGVRHIPRPLVAMAPERTIQGQALKELGSLPQVIGGIDARASARARALFERLGVTTIEVSSLEIAEFVKLINNSHTDVIYSFGNEVALCAEALGLDGNEAITAANLDYPRPDLARPGFVGGGCLAKDPWLLISSVGRFAHVPQLVLAARDLNEGLPARCVRRVLEAIRSAGEDLSALATFVSGFPYKGRPETDDLRGSHIPSVLRTLDEAGVGRVLGHDFVVATERIEAFGVRAVTPEEGFRNADLLLVLNDHAGYSAWNQAAFVQETSIRWSFDAWGVLPALDELPSVNAFRLGRG